MFENSLIRSLAHEALAASGADEPYVQRLLDSETGAKRCGVTFIKTPPGMGSPFGLHVHDFEQVFYILEGTMTVEVDEVVSEVGPGHLVVFPAGVPHRNWNASAKPILHLSIAAPPPPPGESGTRQVPESEF